MTILQKIGRALRTGWMKFAHVLAVANTTLLLTIVYLLLIGPASLLARLLGKDFLKHRINRSGSFWTPKEPDAHSLDHARHQF